MPRPSQFLVGMTLLMAPEGSSAWVARESASLVQFDLASVRLEQNVTDDDMEVVIEATAGEEGLTKFQVVSPDGRTLADFTAPAPGVRHMVFESPEPKGGAGLKAAYPQGAYNFSGVTAGGEKLQGIARLGHKLPGTAAITNPKPGSKGVPVKGLVISWTPVADLAAYIVSLEQPEQNVTIEARVPGTVASFAVPDGFLSPGKSYILGIGTVTKGGNIAFLEASFTTEGKS